MQLCVAPAEAADLYDAKVNRWQRVAQGLDLAPIRDLAVNTLLRPPRAVGSAGTAGPGLRDRLRDRDRSARQRAGRRCGPARAGTLHGVCGGIVTTLVDRVEISNLPGDPGTSNFAHAFLPIDTPVAVAEGDGLEIQVDSYDGDELRWIVTITAASSGATRRFTHSTFLSRTLSPETLRKRDPNYRPVARRRGPGSSAISSITSTARARWPISSSGWPAWRRPARARAARRGADYDHRALRLIARRSAPARTRDNRAAPA